MVTAISTANIRDIVGEAHHSTSSIPVHQNKAAHAPDKFN
jgi:hypothetical protein